MTALDFSSVPEVFKKIISTSRVLRYTPCESKRKVRTQEIRSLFLFFLFSSTMRGIGTARVKLQGEKWEEVLSPWYQSALGAPWASELPLFLTFFFFSPFDYSILELRSTFLGTVASERCDIYATDSKAPTGKDAAR